MGSSIGVQSISKSGYRLNTCEEFKYTCGFNTIVTKEYLIVVVLTDVFCVFRILLNNLFPTRNDLFGSLLKTIRIFTASSVSYRTVQQTENKIPLLCSCCISSSTSLQITPLFRCFGSFNSHTLL